MHSLQEIRYVNLQAARKAKARALKQRNSTVQEVIAKQLARVTGKAVLSEPSYPDVENPNWKFAPAV